jgi:hypothetical protein
MSNPGFYVYQGSSGDWYIDCLTSAREWKRAAPCA